MSVVTFHATVEDVKAFPMCIADMTEFTLSLLWDTILTVPCHTEISFIGKFYSLVCSVISVHSEYIFPV
jgi:hypothetical protein